MNTSSEADKNLAYVTAQLRHGYSLLVTGEVPDTKLFGERFISPLIARLEDVARELLEEDEARLEASRD